MLSRLFSEVLRSGEAPTRPKCSGSTSYKEKPRQIEIETGPSGTLIFEELCPQAMAWLRHISGVPTELALEHLALPLREKRSHGKGGGFFIVPQVEATPPEGSVVLLKGVNPEEVQIWSANLGRVITHFERREGRTLLMRVLAMGNLTFQALPEVGKRDQTSKKMSVVLLANGLFSRVPRPMVKFDLKGHYEGRMVEDDELSRTPSAPLKDGNFKGKKLDIGEPGASDLLQVLGQDINYLKTCKIEGWMATQGVMDYSLLLGVQDTKPADAGKPGIPAPGQVMFTPNGAVAGSSDGSKRYYLSLIDTATHYSVSKSFGTLAYSYAGVGSGSAQEPPVYAERMLADLKEKIC